MTTGSSKTNVWSRAFDNIITVTESAQTIANLIASAGDHDPFIVLTYADSDRQVAIPADSVQYAVEVD